MTVSNLTRKVSFKEDSSSRSPAPSSVFSSYSDVEAHKKKCRPRCNRCCAWTSVAVGIVVAVFLVGLIVFYSFLVSNMPRFYLNWVEVHKIKVVKDKNGDSTLTADVSVVFNVSNDNGKISYDYGHMTAEIALDGVHLGRSEVAAFHQETENTTRLELRSQVETLRIEEADGDDLVSNSLRHLLTVDLSLVGFIEYRVRDSKVSGCPFKVLCQQAPQPILDSGVGYGCNVRMNPLRV